MELEVVMSGGASLLFVHSKSIRINHHDEKIFPTFDHSVLSFDAFCFNR